MIDLNSLPFSSGVLIAGVSWLALSSLVLGPIVADRTIEQSGWPQICERELHAKLQSQVPQKQSMPRINCSGIAAMFGPDAAQLCRMGADIANEAIKLDPSIAAREALRKRKVEQLQQIANQAPSACSCASQRVASDRMRWGMYAGSARLIGNTNNLQSELQRALRAPACNALQEG